MAELIDDVKNYLDITWDDENTDKKLTGIIERGKSYLKEISGSSTDLNFDIEGLGRSLLFDYCRYARSNALEVFEKNFISDLLKLRISQEVVEYETEDGS